MSTLTKQVTCAPEYQALNNQHMVSIWFAAPRRENFNISTDGNAFLVGHEADTQPKTIVPKELIANYESVEDMAHDYASSFTGAVAVLNIVEMAVFKACGRFITEDENSDLHIGIINAWRSIHPTATKEIKKGSALEQFLARTDYGSVLASKFIAN